MILTLKCQLLLVKNLNTFYEYYIETADEIKAFVKMFAVNQEFDIEQYLTAEAKPANLLTTL